LPFTFCVFSPNKYLSILIHGVGFSSIYRT